MIRQVVAPVARAQRAATIAARVPRAFSTTAPIRTTAGGNNALPARKPVGAFRGGLFGFLLGTVTAGASVYYYVLKEYRVSNEMLTDDIYSLQNASQKLNKYITELETKLDNLHKK
ncbi:uncharacterized protein TRUGW13939_06019 [Talaromyces rugulosus]|uniref:Uncharacterized protein n=1 Tax=Talaromyces rugulosus TaxID=121627 RepID=A0A7H8QZQ2_TALRU|nr:uncharacterized protein TRUGW13939_06019 [Talaromyces rugulosus]QKX58891.1 hypothetical protein TRUGW13939_06019 [Talaromyces rugulosus]